MQRKRLPRGPYKPHGVKYSRSIRVCLPREVDSALRQMRRIFRVSISATVRKGVEEALANAIKNAVALVKDPKVGSARKLEILKFLGVCREAHLALHHPEIAEVIRQVHTKIRVEKRMDTIRSGIKPADFAQPRNDDD